MKQTTRTTRIWFGQDKNKTKNNQELISFVFFMKPNLWLPTDGVHLAPSIISSILDGLNDWKRHGSGRIGKQWVRMNEF